MQAAVSKAMHIMMTSAALKWPPLARVTPIAGDTIAPSLEQEFKNPRAKDLTRVGYTYKHSLGWKKG